MKKAPIVLLLSSLGFGGLFGASCGSSPRQFHDADGSSGDGEVSTSGGTANAGNGGTEAMHSAGTNAIATGGDDAGGGSGSGASSGAGEVTECTDRQKLCDGVCVDIDDPAYGCDPNLCTTDACPDAPGAELVCDSGQCLLGSCGAGTKKCDGQCVSLTDPAYGCGAATCDASSCPSQATGATVICEESACVIGTCPADYKKCGDKCVAISDPTYGCGATTCDATSCPPAGTATLVCQNSACVTGTCGPGTKKCGSNCVTTDANNGCADPSRCTACANNEACSGTPSTCQCVPTPKATACAGKCGSVSNGCGGTYTCGTCTSPQTCGGGGTPNVCGCTPTTMTTACSGKNCGSVSNGCGGTYTCGSCTSPQTCGGSGTSNVCGCTPVAMTTACSGKNCGSVPNGCGGTYTCGTCSSPQTCGGTGTANVCGCSKTAMATACSGKSCGSAADGCGGTYTCGTCSSTSAPVCVSNACKQCASVADCPAGTFNCTNNTCACRVANSANVIKDGGFDSSSVLSKWTIDKAQWTNTDADACPASGSVKLNGTTITRCFQVPVAGPGTSYSLGIRFTASSGGAGCAALFYAASNCTVGLPPNFINLGASDSSVWTSDVDTAEVPEGTSSIFVQCQGNITIDQIYLRAGLPGSGF